MSQPWIGSLGVHKDAEKMTSTGCWNHRVDDELVPSDVRCAECRRIWRAQMQERGLEDSQIRAAFDAVGATWLWTTVDEDAEDESKLGVGDRELLGLPALQKAPDVEDEKPVYVRYQTVEMTDWHQAENDAARARQDACLDARGDLKDQNPEITAAELAVAIPMPVITIYVDSKLVEK